MFDLKELGRVEWRHESYEFDLTGVWVDEITKVFYWADDTGCSCPTPFEDLKGREEMEHGSYERMADRLSERFRNMSAANTGAREKSRKDISDVMKTAMNYV